MNRRTMQHIITLISSLLLTTLIVCSGAVVADQHIGNVYIYALYDNEISPALTPEDGVFIEGNEEWVSDSGHSVTFQREEGTDYYYVAATKDDEGYYYRDINGNRYYFELLYPTSEIRGELPYASKQKYELFDNDIKNNVVIKLSVDKLMRMAVVCHGHPVGIWFTSPSGETAQTISDTIIEDASTASYIVKNINDMSKMEFGTWTVQAGFYGGLEYGFSSNAPKLMLGEKYQFTLIPSSANANVNTIDGKPYVPPTSVKDIFTLSGTMNGYDGTIYFYATTPNNKNIHILEGVTAHGNSWSTNIDSSPFGVGAATIYLSTIYNPAITSLSELDNSRIATVSVYVEEPNHVIQFSANPTTSTLTEYGISSVVFTYRLDKIIEDAKIDFGDGMQANIGDNSEGTVTHAYTTNGVYEAILTSLGPTSKVTITVNQRSAESTPYPSTTATLIPTTILTETPTCEITPTSSSDATVTETPLPIPTIDTAEPTLPQPTVLLINPLQTSASPVPVVGIIAGLGAAALIFKLRRR